MRFSFETIGNATLVFYENGRPVLATDPWLVGTCYFGSWGLDRPFDERELEAVRSAEYIWISHGHPDHLHFESLALLPRDKKILVPDHYRSEVCDSLRQQGFAVRILPYRQWQQLSPGIRCLCLDNENQDGILLVEAGDSLVANLNDSPLCGEGRFIRKLVRRYERSKTYLAALCAIDADMINIIDRQGRRVTEPPENLKPGAIWGTARRAVRLGVGTYVSSSSQHVYLRPDSAWANPYRITWVDIQRNWTRPQVRIVEPYAIVDLDTGSVAPKDRSQPLQTDRSAGATGSDDYTERLTEAEWSVVGNFIGRFETLRSHFDFVEFVVAGERRRFPLRPYKPSKPESRLRGFSFHVPRHSLLAAVNAGYFDDLLIGNFMQTELHNATLYPWFTPLVSKLGGNAKVFTNAQWRAFRRRYFFRNPLAYLRGHMGAKAARWSDTARWLAEGLGVKPPLKRLYRRLLGDPVF